VALNRRLAPAVYIGTVPLCGDGTHLTLGGAGTPVEWLVKMHRLPRERSLDRLAATDALPDDHLHALMSTLANFYATAPRAPWDGRAYRRALTHEIETTAAELTVPSLGMDPARVADVAARLAQFITDHAELFHARIAAQHVIDAHGDLRPEHVFLTPEPQIIDCLEFSAELRLLDAAAEIAFLALECERLGHPRIATRIVELYRLHCRDDVDRALLAFYRASRAFVRAKVAAWHLYDELPADAAAHWHAQAEWYLNAAANARR
jgi:aminoglycoside phosphotransferase family enzyme